LVLSTTTNLVSPQFHVVFDDNFSTTSCLKTNSLPSNWSTLLTTSCEKYVDDNIDTSPFVDNHWFQTIPELPPSTDSSSSQREPHSTPSPIDLSHSQRESLPPPNVAPSGWNPDHPYSTRFCQRYLALPAETSTESNTPIDDSLYSAFISIQDSYPIHSPPESNFLEHYACAASSNPDVLHYGTMLHDPDRKLFETDMQREVCDLLQTDTVELAPLPSVPSSTKILPAIWSFRHKRAPDWTILKHKARLCPHGGHQVEGEHFWETYAPVVNWQTVRLVLILSLLSNLNSRQIDYVNAYTQGPADCDIFRKYRLVLR